MSFVLDSPEATSLGGAIRPLLESGKSEELKQQKSESKSQYDRESVTHPSRLKPTKDLKESDFSVYDDYPHPVMYVHKNFTYMNKAMIDRDKALAEFKKNRVRRGAWDVEPVPSSLWLCGGIRPYTITEKERPPWRLKPTRDLKESDFSVYDNDPNPFIHIHMNFTYMNKAMIDKEKALEELRKNRVKGGSGSFWDAEAVPISLGYCGGVRPYTITEETRPRLIHYSNLSLNKYNAENQGANFVFDDLVKATWVIGGYTHYITFKATDASSNSSVAQTFQAKVTHEIYNKDKEPKVHLIRLKPTEEESNTQ